MLAKTGVIITLVVLLGHGVAPTDAATVSTTTTTTKGIITFEELYQGRYGAEYFNATWISGNEIQFTNTDGALVMYNLDTESTTVLVANTSKILQNSSMVASLSADKQYVLLAFNVEWTIDSSFNASYAVIDVSSGEATIIAPAGVSSANAILQNCMWSPTGLGVAFVYSNNVYYQPNLTATPQQLTSNGQLNLIYNGVTDWVYNEEVFGTHNAMWFANDGGKMAYATFDDTGIRVMSIPHYAVSGTDDFPYVGYRNIPYPKEVFGTHNAMWFANDGGKMAYATFDDTGIRVMSIPHYAVSGTDDFPYVGYRNIPYPKSGTKNPTVTVTLQNLASNTSTIFSAPSDIDSPVLKAVTFAGNDSIAIMWNNRVQSSLRIVICSEGNSTVAAACSTIYNYTEANGWIDTIPLIFNTQGDSFITILPAAVGNVSYQQVVQVTKGTSDLWTSKSRTNTTHNAFSIFRWNEEDDIIWYKGNGISDKAEQHVYKVNSTGDVSCFTCGIERSGGGECLYNEAVFSPGDRAIINCDGPSIPQVHMYDLNGTLLSIWANSTDLADFVSSKDVPVTLFKTIPMGDGQSDAEVLLQVPSDYASRTNVPLLVYTYGGPGTSLVTKRWHIDWGTSMVSRYGMAVANIDARGSNLGTVANLFSVNRRVGTIDIEDQINATRYLQNNLEWLDSSRACIWGWSHGGYVSSLALARGGDVFKCAMSVAPVVDWHLYDAVFIERYMDTPTNNVEGYKNSSLLTRKVVKALRTKQYFLAHGTEDTNVHCQNSFLLAANLQQNNVSFEQKVYTDNDHGIGSAIPHLYFGMETFLNQSNMLSN